MKTKNVLRLITIGLMILFMGCFLDNPYGYYELVRFSGMVIFSVLAYYQYKKNQFWFVIWCASILLINPFIKIALGRELWLLVDSIWIVLLAVSLFIPKRQLN